MVCAALVIAFSVLTKGPGLECHYAKLIMIGTDVSFILEDRSASCLLNDVVRTNLMQSELHALSVNCSEFHFYTSMNMYVKIPEMDQTQNKL